MSLFKITTLFFCFISCFFASLQAGECGHLSEKKFLLSRFDDAKKGEYIVINRNGIYTLMYIHDINCEHLMMQEISISEQKFKPLKLNWKEWMAKGAPRHTSWLGYEINLNSGLISELYSFNRQTHLQTDKLESFITTLLNLDFKPMAEEKRRKIGPPPSDLSKDNRKFWSPPMKFEGEYISDAHFSSFQATWPEDGSELGGKNIEVFLLDPGQTYPSYLPYWLQIDNQLVSTKFRITDTGNNMEPYYKEIPRRPPSLTSYGLDKEGNLYIVAIISSHFQDVALLALEENQSIEEAVLLPFSRTTQADGSYSILVPKETLQEKLQAQKAYYFYLSPPKSPYLLVQTQNPLVVK